MSEKEKWLVEAEAKLKRMPEEAKQIRETAIQDLFFFAKLVNPGYVYGDIHKKIYKWLEEYNLFGIGQELTSNKLIMLPRGHLKSHMVATWCAWLLTKHPEVTILYLSATAELATTQLFAIQNILGGAAYQRYFPEYINPQEGKRERWSYEKISVDHPKRKQEGIRDPSIATAGLTTNTTGWHADVIIADDLVIPENAYTEEGRANVSKKASQFTSIRNAGGFTLACGTRYHPSDIYDVWKKQEYDVYNDDFEVIERRPVWEIVEFAIEEDGLFLWPRTVRADGKSFGFDNRILSRIKAEYSDRIQFFAQYYNNPNDPGSERINRSKFQYYDPRYLKQADGYWFFKGKRLNVYASIDFAFSLSKKADFTAIVVIGVDEENFLYILDIDRFKTDKIATYFDHLKSLYSKWEFRKLRAEVTVAQTIIVRDLKDKLREEGLRISIDENRPTRREGTKEERIASALEHRYESMSVWHFKGGYIDVLEEELILARPPHDDIKDALASAVEIAIKPKRGTGHKTTEYIPQFHPRFGGVRF